MQELTWTAGQDLFIESFSPENKYGVVFEDDGESAYFYAVEKDEKSAGLRVLDALHIYENETGEEEEGEEEEFEDKDPAEEQDQTEDEEPADEQESAGEQDPAGEQEAEEPAETPTDLKIIWSKDWLKCALVLDGLVHALFDFENQGGYNINEFPPPNEFWTQGHRKLTSDLIQRFF